MSKDRFQKIIEAIFGEEYLWKEYILKTDGIQVINKLSSRAPNLLKIGFDKIGILPRVAILKVMDEIKRMTTSEATGEIGGFYIAFVKGLMEEMQDSRVDSEEYFKVKISRLQQITQEDQVENLEATKEEVCEIYRQFMMTQTHYADAEYEGSALADNLGIHIVLNSISPEGNNYQAIYGPPASEEIPTVTLRFTQGERGAHYVLDKVNEELIPHSIVGEGDCLFASIAQGILELYIQYSGDETSATSAKRRISQIYKGVQLDLISRDTFVAMLQHSHDLLRQEMSNKLYEIEGELLDHELNTLRDLIKYDVYQTVRIAASKALYIKGTEHDKLIAKQTITALLTFPGLGMQHFEGYDLVREMATEGLSFIIKNKKTEYVIDPTMLSILRNSMTYDAFQTVSIAASKVLYLNGNDEDRITVEYAITDLILDVSTEAKESFGWEIVRTKAVESIAIWENLNDTVVAVLDYLKDYDSSSSIRRAALQILNDQGLLKKLSWAILEDKETEAIYGSNGQVKLAIKFHPLTCVQDMALHKLLLDQKDNYKGNFISLVQKFLANGTHEYPNRHSVAFLQALKYSINEYYQLPFGDENEIFVAKLFSLPGNTTPTLELFDILLKDFISKSPQGKWSSHEHKLSHYKFMTTTHEEVAKAIKHESDNMYRKTINIVMSSVVENLYFLLGVFCTHTKIQGITFSDEEVEFMEMLKHNSPVKSSYQSLFNGKETDHFHVNSSLRDSQITSDTYFQMESIRITRNLKPHMQNVPMTEEGFASYLINNI